MATMFIMLFLILMFIMVFFHLHMLLGMDIISISKIEHNFFQDFTFNHVGTLNIKSFWICWWKNSFFSMLIMIIFITVLITMFITVRSGWFNVVWKSKNAFLISETNTKVSPVSCFGDANPLSSFCSIRIC